MTAEWHPLPEEPPECEPKVRTTGKVVGYARTSTAEQQAGLAAQERDLTAAGAERIVSERISSVVTRPGWERCLASLTAGDVLIVTKPCRMARSTWHLLSIVEELDRRDVGLILLSMGGERLDTRNPTAKFMLTMLAACAEFERTLMLERQREGVVRAKAEGKYKGRRPRIVDVVSVEVAAERARRGQKPLVDRAMVRELVAVMGPGKAARELGIGVTSVYRAMAE